MDSVLTTLTIAGGVTGLLATLATVPFSPARFWSWRLRKHTETVKALDPERQANQYEILMRRADYFASRVAAAHHFPTDRTRFRLVALIIGSLVGIFASVIYMTASGRNPLEGLGFFDLLTLVVAAMMLLTWADMTWKSYKHTRWHRERFIRKGCPPTYAVPPTLRDALRESRAADADPNHLLWRRQERATTLRRNGTLPSDWKPVSWSAGQRRKLSALVRGRPWYVGGFLS